MVRRRNFVIRHFPSRVGLFRDGSLSLHLVIGGRESSTVRQMLPALDVVCWRWELEVDWSWAENDPLSLALLC